MNISLTVQGVVLDGCLATDRLSGRQTLSFESRRIDAKMLLRDLAVIPITLPDQSVLRARPLGIFDICVVGPGGILVKGLWLDIT